MGTPPAKPLGCKFWLNTMGALFCDRRADPTGGEPRLSSALFSFVSVDIIEMSPSFCSQMVHLSFSFRLFTENKKPCSHRVSRVGKFRMDLLLPAYLRFIQISFRGLVPHTTWIGQGKTHNPGLTGYDVSLVRPTLSAKSGLICACGFSLNVQDGDRMSEVTSNPFGTIRSLSLSSLTITSRSRCSVLGWRRIADWRTAASVTYVLGLNPCSSSRWARIVAVIRLFESRPCDCRTIRAVRHQWRPSTIGSSDGATSR